MNIARLIFLQYLHIIHILDEILNSKCKLNESHYCQNGNNLLYIHLSCFHEDYMMVAVVRCTKMYYYYFVKKEDTFLRCSNCERKKAFWNVVIFIFQRTWKTCFFPNHFWFISLTPSLGFGTIRVYFE